MYVIYNNVIFVGSAFYMMWLWEKREYIFSYPHIIFFKNISTMDEECLDIFFESEFSGFNKIKINIQTNFA